MISSYLHNRTLEASFLTALFTRCGMRAGVAQGGFVSPVLFILYVNDLPVPSRHVELALYADDTAIIATSLMPALLVSFFELYLGDLERWLREWKNTIKVSKSNALILDSRLTWRLISSRLERKLTKFLVPDPLLNRRTGLTIRNGGLLYKQLIRSMMDCVCPIWRSAPCSHVRKL